MKIRYWINTISHEHVRIGLEGGFTQADHGKAVNIKKLSIGDYIVFYSPRTKFRGGEPLQMFTALGRVADAEPYQVEMTPDFLPWRRRVEFLPAVHAAIKPMINNLEFMKDKTHWGYPFRRGLFEIEHDDFLIIANGMGITLPEEE